MSTLEDKRLLAYYIENKSVDLFTVLFTDWSKLSDDPQLAFVSKRLQKIAKHKAKLVIELGQLIADQELALEGTLNETHT